MMKKLLAFKLKVLAKMVLAKYRPDIIGVTGSVGKTGAKEAITQVLTRKFKVRGSDKNYNNEFGLPLAIFGLESPGKSFFGWFLVLWSAFLLAIFKDKNYPKILVLEMGVDKPGDMDYLLSIARPKVAVLTRVGESHLEFFGSIEKTMEEKSKIVSGLSKNGMVVLNNDDERVKNISVPTETKVITFGFKQGATVEAKNLKFNFEGSKDVANLQGVSFELCYKEQCEKVLLANMIGYAAIYSTLAGASVGVLYGMSLSDIATALSGFKSPRGRMCLISGIKNSMIIDDTYNASPQSTQIALDWIKQVQMIPGKRKIAILGDMLELGSYSEEGHRLVGKLVFASEIDKLFAIGEKARDICRGAEEAGMSRDDIYNFDTADEAMKFIEDRIMEGDLVLIKGSQGMRMEKIVKEIMADPMSAELLLVRQEKDWQNS